MGLDFSGSDAHWSYGGFNNFSHRLAKEIGIDLSSMEGFGFLEGKPGTIPWSTVDDDIKDLLDHSDCDGYLTPEQCEVIAPRLRELVKDWPCSDYDYQQALLLADGMEYCAGAGQQLIFG